MAELRIFHGTRTQPPIIAAMTQPRLMSTNRGNRTVKSLAAEIEFAVALVPTVATNHDRAAKNAAHRPPDPSSSHRLMTSSGFQMYSPVNTLVAEVVIMPKIPQRVNNTGINGPWTNCPFLEEQYRVKSGILTPSVAHEPVTLDIQLSQSQAYLAEPGGTSGWREKRSPLLPALQTAQPIVAMAVTGATISLTKSSGLSFVG